MRDDPRRNLKWMEQQLLDAEAPERILSEDEELMQRVDALIEDLNSEEAPAGNFDPGSKGLRAERKHIRQQFDESAAVLTKTKRQLRREEKLRKKAEKKAGVNRKLGDLVFLAILEIIGILAILGWWLQ